jgi:hypothetical protein
MLKRCNAMGLQTMPHQWHGLILCVLLNRLYFKLQNGVSRQAVLWAVGSLGNLSDDSVRGEGLLWFQARTYLQQLHAAISTSINLLDKLASELLDMVSGVQRLVKEMKAVPKQTILPMFYRIGQHFEVQVNITCALDVFSVVDRAPCLEACVLTEPDKIAKEGQEPK